LNLAQARPLSSSSEDAAAAQRADGNLNRWFLDPIFGRGYPADMLEVYASNAPRISVDEMDEIAAPLDFLGVNSYFPQYVRAAPIGPGSDWGVAAPTEAEYHRLGLETTEMGWPVVPDAFRELFERVQRDYHPPAIYVTENGAAFADELEDNAVHDARRTRYLADHLSALAEAIDAGADVRGYFVWSLLDNFEWGLGFAKRFGITHVNYATQKRTVKDSGRWYSAMLRV
jgi:beta-glucosidase